MKNQRTWKRKKERITSTSANLIAKSQKVHGNDQQTQTPKTKPLVVVRCL